MRSSLFFDSENAGKFGKNFRKKSEKLRWFNNFRAESGPSGVVLFRTCNTLTTVTNLFHHLLAVQYNILFWTFGGTNLTN